uniref:Uncharacterized protein n=1 Tax=Panagrolaimus sp. JU765 TaxID=591449 RepID=A0AC34QB49_9BILA
MKLNLFGIVIILLLALATAQFNPQQRARPIRRGVSIKRVFRQRPHTRPVGPPRQQVSFIGTETGQMPGIRPPKGVAEQLNRAKLKDFKQLGQFLLQRRVHA